jgi:hypothetical protein
MEELVIGRYRVTRKLGTGGMAEVFAARHELMNRAAAIKLLLPEMSARDDIVRRFLQEAQAAARIEHPGIVQVFDVGYTAAGRAYLVMEMLAGEPLGRRLHRQGSLSLEDTLVLIRQLAGAIDAAHRSGIIHRDLKPDNIFLVPDPEMPRGERVKVLDFGLAKLLEPSVVSMELTAQGAVFGTPSFMSPEQCQSAANVDGRADLYSIGCIFHACLCGQPPFRGNDLAVLMAQVGQAPVPLRRHLPGIPPAIEALVLRLLEKDPARRVPSCAALIAEIDQAVAIAGITLDRSGQRAGYAMSDAVTIHEDPGVRRTVAVMAETRRLSPLPRTGVRAGSYPAAPAHVDALPALGHGAGLVAYPRAASEHDGRQTARGSTPTIDNGELGAAPARDGSRKLWWLAGAGLLGGLMAAGVIVDPHEEAAAGMEPIVLSAAEPQVQADAAEETPSRLVVTGPATEIDHLLAQAEDAVSRRAWDDALAALRTARGHEHMDPTRMERVRELAHAVRAGQRRQAAFDHLHAAGSTTLALERCIDAWQTVTRDRQLVVECGVAACKARKRLMAGWLHQRAARPQDRDEIAHVCRSEGVALE